MFRTGALIELQEEESRQHRIARRRLRDESNPLELPDTSFIQHYRLNKAAFIYVLEVLDKNLPTKKTFGITAMIKLCACLRFFAEGGYQKGVARDYQVGMAQSTFCEVLSQVLDVFEEKLCGEWITYPTEEENRATAQDFYRKFGIPGVVGCIDGTHINIVAPKDNKHLYYNRKGSYSLNATLICDSRMRIRFVDATHPGACHDSFVWNTSPYKSVMEQNFLERGLRVWLLVCTQISYGVQAIFGPSNSLISSHVHSICDALDLPHLEVQINNNNNVAINLHPYQKYMNDAFLDAIQYLNWTKVGILHEEYYGRIQLRRLIRMPLEVHIRHVVPKNYLTILNEMKDKEIHNLIIDTNADHIQILLKGILKLQMNEYKYHYFFTSFDIELFDLEDFKYNFVNITSYRLVDVNDVAIKEILKDMEAFKCEKDMSQETNRNFPHKNETKKMLNENYGKRRTIEVAAALVFDSVFIFALGLQTLEQSHTLRLKNMSCSEAKPWNGGLSLINYINSVEWRGLTGPIQFKEGRRIQFKLDLVKVKQHSIVKVGEWSPQSRLNITEPSLFFDTGSMNVTLVVITILETPYIMMRYGKNFTGNERFFGFCVDVLELVSRDVGFDYILDLVPDRKYGAKDSQTGEWNGMVAQLMKYKADLAVAPMTITHARESVIDFTKPFMNLGISILFKVPTTSPTRLFSFMNPLAFDIWLYVLAAYFFVSCTIYIVAKLSPIEHSRNRSNVCVNSKSVDFSFSNSFWFTIGTLMQQGSDLSPHAFSTRIVSSIWWFFTLIIIASYTANLAAFLTVERMTTPIENAEDLASQIEISYGTLDSGSTMTFFRDSLIETYRKMWRNMDNKKPSAFTSTYEEGIKRVKESNYAFLMESTMLDYIVQRDCNLTQIGGLLDTKGYGIATPKGSPWRDKISLAILELQEKGDIQMLYDKWWKNTGDTCIKNRNNKKSKANALGLDNIGGIFVVLIVGIGFAICVAMLEFGQHYKFQQKELENVLHSGLSHHDDDNNDLEDEEKQKVIKKRQCQCQSHQCNLQPPIQQQRSLWAEMLDEFLYALRCVDRSQRPAFKRCCSQCHLLKAS